MYSPPPRKMNLAGAVAQVLSKYAEFSGRASRPEYWWWVLVNFCVGIALLVINAATGFSAVGTIISFLYNLAVLLPTWAVTVRRLHDIGKSGWWLLLWIAIVLIPFVGAVVVLIWSIAWLAREGEWRANDYGNIP